MFHEREEFITTVKVKQSLWLSIFTVSEYFKIITISIFWQQLVSMLVAYSFAGGRHVLAWEKKVFLSAHIVAGYKICYRVTIYEASTGNNLCTGNQISDATRAKFNQTYQKASTKNPRAQIQLPFAKHTLG